VVPKKPPGEALIFAFVLAACVLVLALLVLVVQRRLL
jgi:hypothetical protein